MNILDRYIIQKFITTFIFMVAIISLIVVVIDFSENLDRFLEFKAPTDKIITIYYPNLVIFIANLLSPICIFLAVIFFTAKMAEDSEIVAILSGGISFYRFLAPYIVTSIFLTVLLFFFNAYLVPDAMRKRMDFEYEFIKRKYVWDARNIHKKIDKTTFAYLWAYNQFERKGERFVLEYEEKDGLKKKIYANEFIWLDSLKKWRLKDVTIRTLSPTNEMIVRQTQLDTTLKLRPDDIYQRDNLAESLRLDELLTFIELEKERGSDFIKELELEKNERYAYPFASIILTLIGVALSSRKRRGGVALQLGLGLLIAFLYVFILTGAKVAIGESAPGWLSVWIPNIIFLFVALALIRIAPK